MKIICAVTLREDHQISPIPDVMYGKKRV